MTVFVVAAVIDPDTDVYQLKVLGVFAKREEADVEAMRALEFGNQVCVEIFERKVQ